MADGSTDFDYWGAALPWIQNLVFFIAGVVVTALVERRRTLRDDYEVWAWESSRSLLKSGLGASGDAIQYVVNDTAVVHPYEVDVDLWANGKRDIPEQAFNGRDAHIDLGVPIVTVLERRSVAAEETRLEIDSAEGRIVLRPSPVRKGMAARWVLLTDGKPTMRLVNPPMDTEFFSWRDMYQGPRASKTAAKIIGISLIGVAILGFVSFVILARALSLDAASLAGVVGFGVSILLTGGLATLVFGTTAYGSRLRTARRALRGRYPSPSKHKVTEASAPKARE